MEDKNIYNSTYDFDDMKIAICIEEFYNENKENIWNNAEDFDTYDNIIRLAQEIKNNWLIDDSMSNLSEEEHAYIQSYAHKYLEEKYLD